MDLRALPLLLLSLALPLRAERVQAPDAPWRTLRTAHYRIHYPARGDFEPFALEVASKVEGIHAQVTAWVGFESPVAVEVVIRDPVREANGMAVSLLRHPFVTLWKTPPEPESAIGHHRNWVDLLVVHELTHIHHLVRPQDRPDWRDRLLDLPVGPLARKVPRWVSEGYATVIEGKVTGSGRPHSAYRSAVLRQWALEGRLPGYGAVSGTGGFRGGSMAYLVGSAYLEWLEARNPQDPEILKTFWKQLVSAKRRDFDASFRATFGQPAAALYDRWRAEVVHDALELERRLNGRLREGEAWARVDGEVTDLAVSPDGRRLLARIASERFTGLAVWELAGGPKPAKKAEQSGPGDLKDRPPLVPDRQPDWRLARVEGAAPRRAAWDGEAVALEFRLPDSEGTLQPRYARWIPGRRPVPAATPPRPDARGFARLEVEGIWNVAGPDGRPLTRTLSAAWNPAPAPDGKALFFTLLRSDGVEIRRLDPSLPAPEPLALPVDPEPLAPRSILSPADEPSRLPAAVAPPQAEAYRPLRGLWHGSRAGFLQAPAGRSWQLGYGGADLLGQAAWQVLGAAGDAAGPRGANLAAAWRGWRWAPALEAFSALERPSRQEWRPVTGFDRERRGAELSLAFEDRGTWPHQVRAALARERVESLEPGGRGLGRRAAVLDAGGGHRWSPGGRLAFGASAGLTIGALESDGHAATLTRLRAALRLGGPALPVSLGLSAEAGRVTGADPAGLDRFHLGGLGTSLVPESLEANRVEQAALPARTAAGDRLRRARLSLGTPVRILNGPVRLTLEHTAVWLDPAPRPSSWRVAGLEWNPVEDLPGGLVDALLGRMRFSVGVHRILAAGPELKGRTTATVSLVVRP